MRLWLGIMAAVFGLAACDLTKTDFPVRTTSAQAEVEELATNVAIIRLTADNIDAFNQKRALGGHAATLADGGGWDYRIGAGDILDIVVWDHPDLTMPAGDRRTPKESGLRVQSDGRFFYPHVGQMQARGRTPEQVRAELTQKLGAYIPNPQIEVRVVGYNSQAVAVTGEVSSPNRQNLTDVPLTLLDALDAAGGLTPEADARAVMVRRGGRSHQVNLQAFLETGLQGHNPMLRGGDVVSVPRRALEEAYLLGQVVKPSTVDLTRENVTLTQAVTRVGGLKEDQADARGIFVFRDAPQGVTVYQLDASNPVAYLIGARFVIHPQDVIYVTSSPMHRWNRLISSLLPTLTSARTAGQIGTE